MTKFSANQIHIQLELSNAIYLSLDPFNPDDIKVTIKDPQPFISALDFHTTSIKDTFDQIVIPRQVSKAMAATAIAVETNQKVIINTVSSSTFVINLLLGLTLKYLWGMINVLQFVIYMN